MSRRDTAPAWFIALLGVLLLLVPAAVLGFLGWVVYALVTWVTSK